MTDEKPSEATEQHVDSSKEKAAPCAESGDPALGGQSSPSPPEDHHTHEGESASTQSPSRTPARARKAELKPGVYHVPGTTQVRLVRPHRWRSGMFEVFAFKDEDLPEELRSTILRQGGWRDEQHQWYQLVEASGATCYEARRREPADNSALTWKQWVRLGGRYSPARPCESCRNLFRHPDETKRVCSQCVNKAWRSIEEQIGQLRQEVQKAERLPKGCWQRVKEIRQAIDSAEQSKLFSRVRVLRLRQRLHPVYRLLIDRRREEQEAYQQLVGELSESVKELLQKSFANESPNRAVVEGLKDLRPKLRRLVDEKKLGIREFRQFIAELRRVSENEERKFKAYRQALEEKRKRWEENEKDLLGRIEAIEIGIEPNAENWERLLALRQEIKEKGQSGALGAQGRRRLADLVNRLLDQERTLRAATRQQIAVKRKVKKETSRKRAGTFKTRVNTITIGLAFSQSQWNELVSLQRQVIELRNEGNLLLDDFKDVMDQINQKLDTLKKLRGLTS